mmetsp:Transcript_22460/g.53881  ORF Transcript_22460/g.53881 Transcript_22460/m.53881 type:complete len:339 (-) Transcript_22460:289-1305(-)
MAPRSSCRRDLGSLSLCPPPPPPPLLRLQELIILIKFLFRLPVRVRLEAPLLHPLDARRRPALRPVLRYAVVHCSQLLLEQLHALRVRLQPLEVVELLLERARLGVDRLRGLDVVVDGRRGRHALREHVDARAVDVGALLPLGEVELEPRPVPEDGDRLGRRRGVLEAVHALLERRGLLAEVLRRLELFDALADHGDFALQLAHLPADGRRELAHALLRLVHPLVERRRLCHDPLEDLPRHHARHRRARSHELVAEQLHRHDALVGLAQDVGLNLPLDRDGLQRPDLSSEVDRVKLLLAVRRQHGLPHFALHNAAHFQLLHRRLGHVHVDHMPRRDGV